MDTSVCADPVEVVPVWTSAGMLDDVARGRILLVKGALQTLGFMEQFRETSLAGIASVSGQATATRVGELGFDRLHEIVPVEALAPMVHTLTGWFAAKSRSFVSALQRGFDRPLFSPDRAWPRAMVPYDIVASRGGDFARYLGHLVPHNPHRDSWFSQPLNGINAWIAIGPVRKGNSLMIYPSVFGQELARTDTDVALTQPVGRPVAPAMDPGDMLLFHGDHLHSSELNVTDRTRYVVSFRLTADAPVYAPGQKQTKYGRIETAAHARGTP